MTERKLATIRQIDQIKTHPNADALEIATIGGWQCVVKKGEFQEGELVIYLEIDSWVPTEIAPFLSKGNEPREYNGIKGERLRSVKLRGELSQGLVLPISLLNTTVEDWTAFEGDDVTTILGVQKWEKPIPANLRGQIKGNFPSFIPKTDQERVQNLSRTLPDWHGEEFEVTIKLDGSSMTVYECYDSSGVCSRNIDLKEDENNVFWQMEKKYDIIRKLRDMQEGAYAIQGEVVAPNIQGNHEKVAEPDFFVFDVFNIDMQSYLLPAERRAFCERLGLKHVPVLDPCFVLNHTIQELLDYAEGEGMNADVKREGVVFKSCVGDFSFKAISNSYLLKKGE